LNVSFAQTIDADSLFLRARNQAFAGEYDAARRTSRELLLLFPSYSDAEILIGKTYVWESRPDLARMTLIPILNRNPNNYEVLTLLIDNAIVDKNYDEAISYTNRTLGYYPNDMEILYRKARALFLKGERSASIEVIDQMLAIDSNHTAAKDLKEYMSTSAGHLYLQAAEELANGQREQARETLRQVLAENPDYFDASLLMAYIHGWDGRLDSARLITQQLVRISPNNYELLNLMIHVEIWDNKYPTSLLLANRALEIYPNDQNFLYQKARTQYLMQDYQDALETLEQLLSINPEHKEADELYQYIKTYHMYKDYVFLENYYEFTKKPGLSHKLVQSLGLAKWEKFGTFIAKINIGSELSASSQGPALQYEIEAYPKITSTSHLYLNYAFSGLNNVFFPNHRTALEFFQRLPKGFEASLGFRTIYWYKLTWIHTGSVSYLHDNTHYFAIRPYFNQTKDHFSSSLVLTYRYYFTAEREDYFYALTGFGSYSDEFLQLTSDPRNSFMIQLGALKFINSRWNLQASLGYFDDDGYRSRWQGMVGARYYFNMAHGKKGK
jgi:YaiO family outer membrane protein